MKTIFLSSVIGFCVVPSIWGQNEKQVELQEVKVQAARIVQKADGRLIFPSDSQRKASTNGYNLLSKLSLPDLKVDEINHSISSKTNRGEVQIRINGVIVSKADMLALNPALIRNINFVDNPGVRYGEDVAYVIDIRTQSADTGYTVGLETSNALTCWLGDNTVYSKLNWKQSELGVTYDFGYRDVEGTRYHETADYLLNDGSHYIISRDDEASRKRHFNNALEVKYNLADSASYVFQAKLATDFNHELNNDEDILVTIPTALSHAIARNHSKSMSPVLDLYFFHTLGTKHSVTANLVGTHISTDTYNYQDEGMVYEYLVDGKTSSLMGEIVYENRMNPFTLSLGSKWNWKYTSNDYSGDVNSVNGMHNSSLYLFGEIKGRLGNRFAYVAGLGASNQSYRQGENSFNFWLFRPKATLSWKIAQSLQLKYAYELSQHTSQIAMISNTQIRVNSMEWKVGNPDITPNSVVTHDLTLNYTIPRLNFRLLGEYRNNRHPNMTLWTRTADNQFLSSQSNQRAIKMLYATADVTYDIIPDVLQASCNGGIYRFINLGDNYSHYYTSYTLGSSLQAFLGNWTLTAQTDNGWRWMEGESKNRQASNLVFEASYHIGNCDISLLWNKPFSKNPMIYQTKVLDSLVQKNIFFTSRSAGNMVVLNFSWKLHRGKQYNKIQKRMNNQDKQTGIL